MSDLNRDSIRGLRAPSIEVDYLDSSDDATDTVLVVLRGWHDLTTRKRIETLLAPLDGSVLVDLRDCDFIPLGTIRVLVAKAHELREHGADLQVAVPPRGPKAARTVELIAFDELVNVYQALADEDEVVDLTGRFEVES